MKYRIKIITNELLKSFYCPQVKKNGFLCFWRNISAEGYYTYSEAETKLSTREKAEEAINKFKENGVVSGIYSISYEEVK